MAYEFLTPKNIFKLYKEDKSYTDTLTQPFPEFTRIARNRPYEGADPAYPKTTDGTTASIIQKTPKRVVQQLPTGTVISDNEGSWIDIVASFIYTNKILPCANEDYGLFEKSHLIIESGLSFGFGASLCPFLSHDGYLSPDMVLPYWGDITVQKGKKSGNACKRNFIRSWWQNSDVKALIDSEDKLKAESDQRVKQYEADLRQYKADLANYQQQIIGGFEGDMQVPAEPPQPSIYEPTWDTANLKEVLDKYTSKDQQGTTPTEEERGVDASGIELVTGFQVGVGAKFYTFHPESKTVVRTKTNKDPRGKIPINWFYGDIDGTNPLGRGIVELIGGLQNLIDSDMQMYQYNRALALAPPVLKVGTIGDFQYKPNAVIETNDPSAKLVPLTVDTSAIANYPQLYQLQQSQLLNLVASPNSSIPSNVGAVTQGKTPAALSQQKAAISVDDNAIRKRYESWFEAWSETAINLYFGERSGVEVIQLDKVTADKLRKLAPTSEFDPETAINEQNQLIMNYDIATPALKFRVDASTSKMQDSAAQLTALNGLFEALDASPSLAQLIVQNYPDKLLAGWNSMVSNSGIENPEDMSIDLDDFAKKQEAQKTQAQQVQVQQMQQPQQQSAITPQHIDEMRQLGFPDEMISQAVAIHNGRQGAANE